METKEEKGFSIFLRYLDFFRRTPTHQKNLRLKKKILFDTRPPRQLLITLEVSIYLPSLMISSNSDPTFKQSFF